MFSVSLGHGHRALSSVEGTLPDILAHAADLAHGGDSGLPGLNLASIVEMKLAGNRESELYRLLLVAQCNALSNAMPFLFERIDDETELLLPDNLLRTDSVIAKLVSSIEEVDWKAVEIIGWLYQFYISEKKDEVIGKVVKSEDIPAATQLFTPNWIVQYLVQNSIGRLWLMANPASTLHAQWQYYVAPAEQTPEVQAQLHALIKARGADDGDSLNPESITLLDPACGSGHILVEAYEVLKGIYLERGYQLRSIPRLILEKNLFGLDIDDRAAQMAGFALLMKARADDRRLFNEPIRLNVLSLQESKGLDAEELTRALQIVGGSAGSQIANRAASRGFGDDDLFPGTHPQFILAESSAPYMESSPGGDLVGPAIASLIATFAHAKTFGSLIQIPKALNVQLMFMAERLQVTLQSGDLYAKAAAQDLLPLVAQARVLAMQFDAVVANPPYMGRKGMNLALKEYAKVTFPDSKSDLFAIFLERGFGWCKPTGFNSMVTMQSWMFLSSYETMRKRLLCERTLCSMVHMGNGVMGIAFGTAATVMLKQHIDDYAGQFSYCDNDDLSDGIPLQFPVQNERLMSVKSDDLKIVPGSPIAYWASRKIREIFSTAIDLDKIAELRVGMATSDNERFLRHWHEVAYNKVKFNATSHSSASGSGMKWFPYSKGGEARKWYGNNYLLVNWENDGKEVIELATKLWGSPSKRIYNAKYFFRPAITWSLTSSTSGGFCARWRNEGFIFDVNGMSSFVNGNAAEVLCAVNSKVGAYMLGVINPTMAFQAGDLARFPYLNLQKNEILSSISERAIKLAKTDWDSFETSWDFKSVAWISTKRVFPNLAAAWKQWSDDCASRVSELQKLETENSRIFIEGYGLQDELSAEVPESQITLARAHREKDCQRLISYAVGCMMGRYSLDAPGLIYANAGNVGFDDGCYASFPADFDGIVPLTDDLWFEDEAASRIREFLLAAWGADTLAENLAWLAESIGNKVGETPDETIRRYLADKFYKDHLQTYKKRPIYWLFSSGKQGAFQALVYLHRYHEGTLSRMRAEYVVPLTGKIQSRIDMLEKDAAVAASTSARNKLAKEVEKLKKKHAELLAYDEQLRHHADMRIELDLDDGVKVNYGKFGDLLAEVKAVTGGASDD